MTRPPGTLWAITSYFNPLGWRRRLANYRLFRANLGVPLVTVELAYGPQFELRTGDADILIQRRGRDIMWQKERLLNIALQALPEECRYVCWIDGDVVFARPDWPVAAADLLQRYDLLQLYRTVHYLAPTATGIGGPVDLSRPSLLSASAAGFPLFEPWPDMWRRTPAQPTMGMAWAARRSLLQVQGFYDACILGAGDRALLLAAHGRWQEAGWFMLMSDACQGHFEPWARAFHARIQDGLGYLEGDIYHLWHGDLAQRRSRERLTQLAQLGFDPATDIALDDSGAWRWNSDKPALHQYICEYLASRREDG